VWLEKVFKMNTFFEKEVAGMGVAGEWGEGGLA
jgi:hypothetical protein